MAEIDALINELEKAKKKGITEVYFGTDIEENRICLNFVFSFGMEEGEEEAIIISPDTHGEFLIGIRFPEKFIQRMNLILPKPIIISKTE